MTDHRNRPNPMTNEEWTVHALNIHGAFLEKKCVDIIQLAPGYTVVTTNYPVEFPPPVNGIRGKESALDIRAERGVNDSLLITLTIECKKNNPEFVDWIFFPVTVRKRQERFVARFVYLDKLNSSVIPKYSLEDVFIEDFAFTDEARETRGNYQKFKGGNITKTANNSISEAAHQVSLATQSIFFEEINRNKIILNEHSSSLRVYSDMQVILPIIITTANLLICEFETKDISLNTGEIDFNKVELKSVPYLVYKYPLPRHLCYFPENMQIDMDKFKVEKYVKMDVIIVNSEHLKEFLEKIALAIRYSF